MCRSINGRRTCESQIENFMKSYVRRGKRRRWSWCQKKKRPLRKKARIDAEISLETAQEGDSSLASLGSMVAEEQGARGPSSNAPSVFVTSGPPPSNRVTEALTQNRQTKEQRQLELEATVRRAAGYSAGVFPGAEMIKNSLQNDPSSSRAGETSTSGLPAQPLASPSRRGSLPPVESSPSHKLRERAVTFLRPHQLIRRSCYANIRSNQKGSLKRDTEVQDRIHRHPGNKRLAVPWKWYLSIPRWLWHFRHVLLVGAQLLDR
jgi:hypothetical protein